MEINNFLPFFPVYEPTKKMPAKEPNETLLHVLLNGWAKQSYLQVSEFEIKIYRETCTMFKQMKIVTPQMGRLSKN